MKSKDLLEDGANSFLSFYFFFFKRNVDVDVDEVGNMLANVKLYLHITMGKVLGISFHHHELISDPTLSLHRRRYSAAGRRR